MIISTRKALRRSASIRRILRRVLPPLLVLTIVLTILLRTFLPFSSPIRSTFRFNADKFAYYMRGAGPGRDAWLTQNNDPATGRPPHPLNESAPGGDIGISIKTGYSTCERLRPQLEALGLVSKQWVTSNTGRAKSTRRLESTAKEESFIVVSDFAPPEGEKFEGIEMHNGVALTLEQMSPRLENHPRVVKYRNLAGAIEQGYDEQALSYSYAFGWELDPEKFVAILELAWAKMPGRKWYVFMDDDTVLVQPSLRMILGNLDHTEPLYIGKPVGDYKGRFAHGGSATILSSEAMRRILSPRAAPILAAARVKSLSELWGEKLLGDTLQHVGVYLHEGLGHHFNGEPPRSSRISQDRFCAPLVSFRGLASAGDVVNIGLTRRGGSEVIRWGDMWQLFGLPNVVAMQPGMPRKNRDHVGISTPGAKQFGGVASAQACWDQCRRQGGRDCLAWTWDQSSAVCYTAPWYVIGDKVGGLQSGVNADRIVELRNRCR
jgi:hypothetical protein